MGSHAIPMGFPVFIRWGFRRSSIVVPEVALGGIRASSLCLLCGIRSDSVVGSYAIPVGFPMVIRWGFTCSSVGILEVVLGGVHVSSSGLPDGVR